MPTIFNPSGFRKSSSTRVVREGSTYSFPDVYAGKFEFFKDRPIDVEEDGQLIVERDGPPIVDTPVNVEGEDNVTPTKPVTFDDGSFITKFFKR